jgi:hypothetical protein
MSFQHQWFALGTLLITLISARSAHAVTYDCVPDAVAEMENRIHVHCAEPPSDRAGYPDDNGEKISFFVVPLAAEQEFLRRFVDMSETAISAGLVLRLTFASGNTAYGGTPTSCRSYDCRVPYAVALVRTGRTGAQTAP